MKNQETESPTGVLSQKIDNNQYILEIRWKDGKMSTTHFPVNGFEVINPNTKDRLGYVSGKQAVETLTRISPNYNFGEFNWQSLFN